MPKRTAATAALAVVFALTLTGCAGTPESAGDERPAPSASESTAPSATPEPLEAEMPANADDPDAKFLAYVRDTLLPDTQIPNATDAQLIEAGHEACRQLESGTPHEEVRVVDGETPHPSTGYHYDTSAIMGGAVLSYCPQFG